MAKGLFVVAIAGVIIYGLTDMSKARKVYICSSAYVKRLEGGCGLHLEPARKKKKWERKQ